MRTFAWVLLCVAVVTGTPVEQADVRNSLAQVVGKVITKKVPVKDQQQKQKQQPGIPQREPATTNAQVPASQPPTTPQHAPPPPPTVRKTAVVFPNHHINNNNNNNNNKHVKSVVVPKSGNKPVTLAKAGESVGHGQKENNNNTSSNAEKNNNHVDSKHDNANNNNNNHVDNKHDNGNNNNNNHVDNKHDNANNNNNNANNNNNNANNNNNNDNNNHVDSKQDNGNNKHHNSGHDLIEQQQQTSNNNNNNNNFEIDFVFTWYNGHDQATADIRERERKNHDPDYQPQDASKGDIRFVDSGELKYSFRGVDKFAPYVHKVFLVVGDNQPLPEWMNANATKLRVVRHSQIFPESDALPTFNSFAIEAAIHNIPDLQEHFVYFNDDMFLAQPVEKSMFFSASGAPQVWFDHENVKPHSKPDSELSYQSGLYYGTVRDSDDTFVAAVKNSNNVVDEEVPVAEMHRPELRDHGLAHNCKAIKRSWLEQTNNQFHDKMVKTRYSKFRQKHNLWSMQVASMLCVQRGSCDAVSSPHQNYYTLEADSPSTVIEQIEKDKPVLFCINNGSGDEGELERELGKLFSNKSSFEK